jgi:hypothetical protein
MINADGTKTFQGYLVGSERLDEFYFFFPDPKFGCQPAAAPFWLGAAAIVLTFSFFGFLDSRLPFCSPLAMSLSLGCIAGYHVRRQFAVLSGDT